MQEDQIRYERNFLSKVIFRLDFQPILKLRTDPPVAFQDRIRSRLPEYEEHQGFQYSSEIGPQGKKDETIPMTTWLFRDSAERFDLTLTFRFLAIEDRGYTSLDDLLKVVTPAVSGFMEAYSDIQFTRIGLRYINEVKLQTGSQFDWDGYIAPHLTCMLSGIGPQKQLSRAMSQTVINRDDHLVVFNHGLFNSEFPAPISRREFILDLDASRRDVEDTKIVDTVRSFNADLLQLFEESIGDKLRSTMRRRSE